MVKKVILSILFLFALTFVSAESIGSFQLDVDDVQVYLNCNNCTSVNFTRVMGPNNQTIFTNLESIEDGTYYYYDILKGNLTQQGTYTYCYNAGNVAESVTGCNTFEITYTGKDLEIADAMIYSILLIFLFSLFLLMLFSIKLIPKHRYNDDGYMVEVATLSYLKPIVIGGCWIVLMAMLYLAANLGVAYLEGQMFGIILFRGWQIMMGLTLVALPLWIIGIIQMWARSKEMKSFLERGVQF